MSRRGRSDEPSLFDLPLVPEDDEPEDRRAVRSEAARGAPPAVEPPRAPADRAATDPDQDLAADLELDEDPFAVDPLAEDDLGEDDPFAEAAAAPPTASPPPAASTEGSSRGQAGFPFAERPPPHRPAGPRPAPPSSRSTAPATPPAADAAAWDAVEVDDLDPEPAEAPAPAAAAPLRAGLGPRLVAAAVDGGVLVAAAGLALIGTALLDVRPGLAGLPGLLVLLLVFSFAYSVVPLAFWGATPGMRAAHLVARDRDGGPLTFGQTALRWLGGLLTLALAGLPMLLALGPLGARSPADRLSRSLTWLRR